MSIFAPPRKLWGAAPEDWDHYIKMGLTEDLLPVVSNLEAQVSSLSNLKAIGKVPSVYNKEGKVRGIVDWTAYVTLPGDVARWRKESDYGICIQCRHWRGIDIDVESPEEANKIVNFIAEFLKIKPWKRYRANSAKCLIPIIVDRHHLLTKRRIQVESGYVEFLGNGCQFVACGTHPSGERYKWITGDQLPVVGLDKLEALLS